MTNTQTTQAGNRALAEQVYDLLMSEIEPDLMLATIPTLDAKYAGETPAEHEARMQRYAVAYKKFDIDIVAFMNDINGSVRATQRHALRAKEEEAKQEETNALNSLASAFN